MSVTDEASRVDTGANRARLMAEPPRAVLPDSIDPEPSSGEWARLVNGPLALVRAVESATAFSQPAVTLPRRFDWPHLQPDRLGWFILAGVWPLGWSATSIWNEFVGTWTLSWGLALPLFVLLLFGDILLMLWGERLPLIGRSSVALQAGGIKLRLFYGRRPRTVGNGFNLLGFIWPVHASIPWPDIARVAVYSATYDRSQRTRRLTMYWVKLWTTNHTGYVALISEMEVQAHELANLLAQHAGLSTWAKLDGGEGRLLDPSLGPLDPATLIIWRADQRRIRNYSTLGSINAELWCAPRREQVSTTAGLYWRTVIKLALFIGLLVAAFNYDYLLSYLLWSPPGPITSDLTWIGGHHDAGNTNTSNQTLIPPLHEVWQTKLQDGTPAKMSLGGGKLLAVSGSYAYVYDAASGSLLNKHDLYTPIYGLRYGDTITAATINADGNYAYFATGKQTAYALRDDRQPELSNLDLNSGKLIWQSTLSSNSSFILEPQHNLIITSVPVTTNSNGSATYYYIIEALNPQTGAQVWRSEDLGAYAPGQIVVGGDTVYSEIPISSNPSTLVELDISNGATRRKKDTNPANNLYTDAGYLYADAGYLYARGDDGFRIYGRDGSQNFSPVAPYGPHIPGVLKDRLIITNSFNGLSTVSASTDQSFPNIDCYNQHSYSSIFTMAASNGLLFLIVQSDSNLFGNTRLLACDLQSGQQVWRSPTLSGDFSGSQMIIGNGMLYLVYDSEIHAFAGAR